MGVYNGVIHEGEYVPSARKGLPIASTASSGAATPARLQLPVYTRPESDALLPLVHKWTHTHLILCVVAAPKKGIIFCGTQDSSILVFCMKTYSLRHVIKCGHNQYAALVLCLCITPDENLLFSAGLDSLVKAWDVSCLDRGAPCTHIVYSLVDIGDIFSLAWSPALSVLFVGAQNAAILWCSLKNATSITSGDRLPHMRFDRFFDSKGPGGSTNALLKKKEVYDPECAGRPMLVEIAASDIIRFAHNGYIYCMDILDTLNAAGFRSLHSEAEEYLASCGGDGQTHIWGISSENGITLRRLRTLENNEAVLSMFVADSSICVGLSDSSINVWDLTTFQLTRSFNFVSTGSGDEVLSLCIHNGCVYKATNMGGLCKYQLRQEVGDEDRSVNMRILLQLETVSDDPTGVFAVHTFDYGGATYLLSGGENLLCLWNITNVGSEQDTNTALGSSDVTNELLMASLNRLIAYKTISKYPMMYLEELRRCAQFLAQLFMSLGAAQTQLFPIPNCNPAVYAYFRKNSDTSTEPVRVLWYAHYDVVEATEDRECWSTDPFKLTARDGNLYARGVSDNKGPILAAVYAVADLHRRGELSTDVVFLIEGEEECGLIGFQDMIHRNKDTIGRIDWIILSNSYWLTDDVPCLNYGLRGVVNALIKVELEKPDRHLGVDGGVSKEPTMDLIQILGTLMCEESNEIQIPHFYDDVRPVDESELAIHQQIKDTNMELQTLVAKWTKPLLTVHRIDVSGPRNNTVISQRAQALVLIRVVPNQKIETIKQLLVEHVKARFAALKTDNKLTVEIFHEAEPWLGDRDNLVFKVLYEKMKLNWGPDVPDPLFIREGGSIPSIRFLEKAFDAPAAQIPCGQASDNAHLKDEKLRLINLFKLRDILTDTFRELGSTHT